MTKVHYAGRLLPRISQPQDDRRRIKFHLTIPSPLDIHTDFGGQERHLSIILMLAPIQFIIAGQVQKLNMCTILSTTGRRCSYFTSLHFAFTRTKARESKKDSDRNLWEEEKGGLEEGNGAIVIPNLNSVTLKQLANQLDSVHSSNYTRRRRGGGGY